MFARPTNYKFNPLWPESDQEIEIYTIYGSAKVHIVTSSNTNLSKHWAFSKIVSITTTHSLFTELSISPRNHNKVW